MPVACGDLESTKVFQGFKAHDLPRNSLCAQDCELSYLDNHLKLLADVTKHGAFLSRLLNDPIDGDTEIEHLLKLCRTLICTQHELM